MGASRDLVAGALLARPEIVPTATFGVFFGLQVTDFDLFGFFSLCHFIFPISYFGLFVVCVVSVAAKST